MCLTLLLMNFRGFFCSLFIFSLLSALQRSASTALVLGFKTFSCLPSGGQNEFIGFFCFVLFCYERTFVVNHWDLAAKFYLKQAGYELKQKLPSSNRSCRSRFSVPMLVSFPHCEPPLSSHKIQSLLQKSVQAHPDKQTDIHSSPPLNTSRLPESSPMFFSGFLLPIIFSQGDHTPQNIHIHPFSDHYGFSLVTFSKHFF